MSLDLATIASDPERIADLAPDVLPRLIGEAEALRARLWARLQEGAAVDAVTPPPRRDDGEDRLLTAAEAAELLGVDRRWIYRKADDLPFTRRLSSGTLRFSKRGLERWSKRR